MQAISVHISSRSITGDREAIMSEGGSEGDEDEGHSQGADVTKAGGGSVGMSSKALPSPSPSYSYFAFM